MSSPQKKRAYNPPQRLSDPQLPLNLALAYLVIRVFPLNADKESIKVYSDGFVTSILALISHEVFEIGDEPATFEMLKRDTDAVVKQETERIRRFNEKMKARGQEVSEERVLASYEQSWLGDFAASFETVPEGAAFLDNLEKDIRDCINEEDEEEVTELPEPIERRSPLGLFLRGVTLTLRKMSFIETSNVSRQVGRWCGVQPGPSTNVGNKKSSMEDTLAIRLGAMQQMHGAIDSGDYAGSLESLRRFYDYQFPSAGRGKHQHALLNLASFHYNVNELPAAKEAVNEAIRVARAEGDKLCLTHCMSLFYRIEEEGSSRSSTAERLAASCIGDAQLPVPVSPMDELWSLKAALEQGEPVTATLRRVHQALGRAQLNRVKQEDKQMQGWTTEYPFDEGAWHASQASLWGMLGSKTLASVHEDLALESELGRGDARLTVLLARAERMATEGSYIQALALLLDFDDLDGMNMASYRRWSKMVWSVLHRQATLSRDNASLDLIAALRPASTVPSEDEATAGVNEKIRVALRKATKLSESGSPAHVVLPEVLACMQLASQLRLWSLYRVSVVTFGEVCITMEGQGMARKAIEEVEKVWPELVTSGDEETVARAAHVLGKAMIDISLDQNQPELMEHAVEHLKTALTSAQRVGAKNIIDSCGILFSLVAELRDESVEQELAETSTTKVDPHQLRDQIRQISEIVKLVGVRVSEQWQ